MQNETDSESYEEWLLNQAGQLCQVKEMELAETDKILQAQISDKIVVSKDQ